MRANRFQFGLTVCLLATFALLIVGCEGVLQRKHDSRVVDVQPPPEDAVVGQDEPVELADFPGLVEEMMETRQAYIAQMIELESAYLKAGDSMKANWARHQRERTEIVGVYPYLTAEVPEQSVDVSPEIQIPEADALYEAGLALYNEVLGIPFAGALEHNKDKVREALVLFKRVLNEYPTSDKVDDCAFYCGDIYKEYLREEDPDNELALRYYQWSFALDPNTPHTPRFLCAVVYEFRRHDRARAVEMYTQVLETEEAGNMSNARFSADRVAALSNEDLASPIKPVFADVSSPSSTGGEDGKATPRSEVTARTPGAEDDSGDIEP